ncbi:hypothetical protein DAPPUDRAFT_315721 [Daphnia pulex]|uniref:Uncharacterized protein n=1 Tax=Daphnia pulex TaxID=6669 RepID=E9GAL5_DAPPU|nr:hypothetical protein DAPPUDRAFT_315721 [Daphnia pulex]|eukprot:EFX83268.1 hypothetical protein DAPPUDRAFT_315721 [Daphnia pulex]
MAQRHLLAQLSPSCQVIRIHTMNLSRSNRLGFRFHRIAQLSSAIGLMSSLTPNMQDLGDLLLVLENLQLPTSSTY